jgi:RNA polymerase sigma-70 factor (ECF subfamily)
MLTFMPWNPRRTPSPEAGRAIDGALAVRVAAGDAGALDTVYRRDAGAVYRYALALGGNPAWAADATQEAFIAFAQRPHGFDAGRGSLAAYLAGMARHHLLALWREGPVGVDPDADGPAGAATHDSPESLLVARQSSAALWAALRRLPWPQREALVLVDLQQRPYVEAAAVAGIELNTLRTRLHRGRIALAALLGAPASRSQGNAGPTPVSMTPEAGGLGATQPWRPSDGAPR